MNPGDLLRDLVMEGLRNLLRHKLRSALTLLGVVFGISAVITMLGIGEGAQRTVLNQISGLGLRNIILETVRPLQIDSDEASTGSRTRFNFGLTHRDVAQIAEACPDAELTLSHRISDRITFQGKEIPAQSYGIYPEYLDLMHGQRVEGLALSFLHGQATDKAVVVNQAFLSEQPRLGSGLGRTIRIGSQHFRIIGVVSIPAHRGQAAVFMPYLTAQRLYGEVTMKREAGRFEYTKTEVGRVVVRCSSEDRVRRVANIIHETLQRNHSMNDYTLTVPLNILESKQQTQRVLNLVLVTIAAISLLVGGIGIMNIMLASINERIPEIGIRRAVGATRHDILLQFLVETTTLTVTGGLLGCIVGLAAVPLASHLTGWAGVVTPLAVAVSVFVSMVVGLVFGIAPAVHAARLDPGAALRHE